MRINGAGAGLSDCIIYTPDRGRTWQIQPVSSGLADFEYHTGHNAPEGIPPMVGWRTTAPHPARFCSYHDLLLFLPRLEEGRISVPEPILISDNCLGGALHSGGPSTLATRDGRTHIVWGEVAEPDAPGVPTYIATYDHATGELSEKVFIAHAPPVNDVHNVPAVVLDSQGYIHVVTGAHGDNFFYARSLRPNDISGGFTEPVRVLDSGWVDGKTDEDGRGAQTYIGLVCDREDTLHLVYRQNRSGVDEYLPDFRADDRLYAPSGQEIPVRDAGNLVRVVEPLAEPGLYTRRRAGGEPVPALFANPARDESRLDPVTPEELEAWTGFKTLRVERSPEALLAAAAEQHHGRELTELLLWLILPLALAEWWFANRTLRQGTRLTESLAIDPAGKVTGTATT